MAISLMNHLILIYTVWISSNMIIKNIKNSPVEIKDRKKLAVIVGVLFGLVSQQTTIDIWEGFLYSYLPANQIRIIVEHASPGLIGMLIAKMLVGSIENSHDKNVPNNKLEYLFLMITTFTIMLIVVIYSKYLGGSEKGIENVSNSVSFSIGIILYILFRVETSSKQANSPNSQSGNNVNITLAQKLWGK